MFYIYHIYHKAGIYNLTTLVLCLNGTLSCVDGCGHGRSGADPRLFKGGGVHLRSTSKNKGGVQEGVQFWAQC